MATKIVTDFDPKKLVFICLKKELNESSNKKECRYAVFNEFGENIDLVFGKKDEEGNIIPSKEVSLNYLNSGKKLKRELQLNSSNFMSKDKANEVKYLSSRKNPFKFDNKCACLINVDVVIDKCSKICIKPNKIYFIEEK